MPWTTPRTWVANETVTAAQLNTHVRDNFNDLRTAKHGLFGRLAALTVPASSWTSLAWDFAVEQNPTMWAASPYPERIAPSLAGIWHIHMLTRWEATSNSGSRAQRIQKNGVTLLSQERRPIVTGTTMYLSATCVVRLNAAGDYINTHVWTDESGGTTLAASVDRSITLTWMGA